MAGVKNSFRFRTMCPRTAAAGFLRRFLVMFCLVSVMDDALAQKASVSTDLLGYANFITMNVEASCPVARHWSVNAEVRYNPFTFDLGEGREDARNRQQAYAAGVRWWPWNVYSGWWLGGKLRYQEYNSGGIVSRKTREGDRYGAGVSGGYSYMLGKHLNIDFGLGFWSGMDRYSVYECPVCGVTEASGSKFFILPTDIMVALSYVF